MCSSVWTTKHLDEAGLPGKEIWVGQYGSQDSLREAEQAGLRTPASIFLPVCLPIIYLFMYYLSVSLLSIYGKEVVYAMVGSG